MFGLTRWLDSGTAARRSRKVVLGLVLVGLAVAILAPAAAGAAPRATRDDAKAGIAVIQVDGLIDPPNAELIMDSIRDANSHATSLLVIKFASGGSVDVDPAPLVAAIRASKVPIAAWVGPSGGKAKGIAALLVTAASVAAVSNGSSIGPADPLRLDKPDATDRST